MNFYCILCCSTPSSSKWAFNSDRAPPSGDRFEPRSSNRNYTDDRQRGRSDISWGGRNDRLPSRQRDENESNDRFSRGSNDLRNNNRSDDTRGTSTHQSSEPRPERLRFMRGDTQPSNNTLSRDRQLGSHDSINSLQHQSSADSSINTLTDTTQRSTLSDRPSANPVQPLQPVKLGKSDNPLSLSERFAQRKAQGISGERMDEPSRNDRFGSSDRYNRSDEPRQQVVGSRFARVPGEERYGGGERRDRAAYGAGRFNEDGSRNQSYGSGRYSASRDLGELPTGPSARQNDYIPEPSKPQPKKLAAAVPQTEIDINKLSERYDSDAVKLDVKEIVKIQNPLQSAIDSKTSVNSTQLSDYINTFDLIKFNQSISDVIVRSIIDNKLTLKQTVDIIQQHVVNQSQQQTLIITILSSYVQRKDEGELQQLVNESQLNILSIIAPDMSGQKLDELLEKHNLLRLKPVADITGPINVYVVSIACFFS